MHPENTQNKIKLFSDIYLPFDPTKKKHYQMLTINFIIIKILEL